MEEFRDKIHYIYHIPGDKIGCTYDLQRRMQEQGFTEWEILETHEDGWLAGDREIELQKEYGYRVERVHYMILIMSGGNEIAKNKLIDWNKNRITKEQRSKGGRNRALRNSNENRSKAGKISVKSPKHISKQIFTCPHCNRDIKGGNYKRWHGNNCKLKSSRSISYN